ncbi:MAG: hypothetical protein JWM27_1738, partial [Gemmatimonadetes bacterium]|nr:hypothetical protein [Gemmatimonadota bacterium]
SVPAPKRRGAPPAAAPAPEPSVPPEPLHLFHVTSDPARALAMNGVLRALALLDTSIAGQARRASRAAPTEAQATVLELFAPEETHAGAVATSAGGQALPVDDAAVAERIATDFHGRTVPYRDVLRSLAPTDLTADEARRAMALLKRSGRATFRSLADDTAEVAFPTTPALPAPRKRRPGAEDAGMLFE